jgi:hypothetical protein
MLTDDTVFFIGNGVLRFAPTLAGDAGGRQHLSPSWAEYMDTLWSFVKIPLEAPNHLALEEFSRLPAPRQAEWFDRELRVSRATKADAAALRLHLLGKAVHQNERILTNDLLRQLAQLIVRPILHQDGDVVTADVITTNLDCAIEQNIAALLDALWSDGSARLSRATISTIVDFRLSARWEREVGGAGPEFRVRLWKLHGCLRDLKIQLTADREAAEFVASVAGDTIDDLCGRVPLDRLGADLSDGWRQTSSPSAGQRPFTGIFSQSEYFQNLLVLARQAAPEGSADLLHEFCELLQVRPLIFVGYTLPEVDVDIMYALGQYRQRDPAIRRWHLTPGRYRTISSDERLRQMGIAPWPYEVPAIGFAAIPGKLEAAQRHEWRLVPNDPLRLPAEQDWRKALQRIGAVAWLEPQLAALRSLVPPDAVPAPPAPAAKEHRLVVAGLGSIWHGFALTRTSDFPVPRRVSAQLVSVDAQVPGGSGLVPVVIAAAAAGPDAVGSVVFFSNVPRESDGWRTIEDLCMSAGVEVHPWKPRAGEASAGPPVGRTSHVIFFDPARGDAGSQLPRQRLILDVQGPADPRRASEVTDWSKLRVPAARPDEDFQRPGAEDFLFTDKEVDPRCLETWQGPTVYETGASGDELLSRLGPAGVRPTIWTAGIGSLVRTLVALAGRTPGAEQFERGPAGVLEYIDGDSRLAALADCGELRERYFAKMISFGQAGIWDHGGVEGFAYHDELDYGVWLRDRWSALAPKISDLMRPGGHDVLAPPHPRIGGGLLTTIHEGGLMALWQWPDGSTEDIVVRVETQADARDSGTLAIECTVETREDRPVHPPIRIDVRPDEMLLSVAGTSTQLRRADPIRRNTLAAGDTVRGIMAYGLWAAAYRDPARRPADIAGIFLASAAMATLKCYAGSFIDFLKLLENVRGSASWAAIWSEAGGDRRVG